MRLIKAALTYEPRVASKASADYLVRARSSKLETQASVKLPSLPIRAIFRLDRLLAYWLWLLLSGFEYALFTAPDALMCMQSFENELRRRDLLFRTVLLRDFQRPEFVDESLNIFQIFERLCCPNGIRQLNLAAQ